MKAQLETELPADPDVLLIANEECAGRVHDLAALARADKAYSDSPAFRLLQILTRLPGSPLDLKRGAVTTASAR